MRSHLEDPRPRPEVSHSKPLASAERRNLFPLCPSFNCSLPIRFRSLVLLLTRLPDTWGWRQVARGGDRGVDSGNPSAAGNPPDRASSADGCTGAAGTEGCCGGAVERVPVLGWLRGRVCGAVRAALGPGARACAPINDPRIPQSGCHCHANGGEAAGSSPIRSTCSMLRNARLRTD